jgi:hypothetical protein
MLTAQGGNVVVRLCTDMTCKLAEEYTLAAGEARMFTTSAANLGQLEVRRGESTARCCTRYDASRVVVTTRPAGALVRTQGDQVVISDVGDVITDTPSLLAGISGLVIDDAFTRYPPGLLEWVRGGGVVSVPPRHELSIVEKRQRAEGAGIIISRGVNEDLQMQENEVASVLPVPMRLSHLGESSPSARAAQVAVAQVPWRAPIFLLALAAIVMSAVVVKRASRIGWRRVLATLLVVNSAASALIIAVQVVSMPSMIERRVVARILDPQGAPWEVGAVAVRARSTSNVTVTTPTPIEHVWVTGDDVRYDRELQRQAMTASATLPSSAALVATWSEPPRQNTVFVRNNVLVNNLGVPLKAMRNAHGASSGPIPVGETASSDLKWQAWYGERMPGLEVEEERLLNEIIAGCQQRNIERMTCTAVIAVLDDGTLYGVELR